jgi:hypothetical protein
MSRRPPELLLPRRRERNWWALAASILLHVVLFSLPGVYWFRGVELARESLLSPIVVEIPVVEMPFIPPEPVRRPTPPPPPPPAVEEPDVREPGVPGRVALTEPGGLPEAPVDTAAGLPSPTGTGRQTVPRLRPQLGEGTLWVQPLPLAPRELAQRLTRTHMELVDSAVSAIVQAYIDSVVAAPAPLDARAPAWTTQIAGRTFGIDQHNIYLGGLKIPSAVLALLPLPSFGNIDLRQAHRLNDIRADLQYAAQRAQTMEEFRQAIREVRERRDREREFERNQRRSPSDTLRTP